MNFPQEVVYAKVVVRILKKVVESNPARRTNLMFVYFFGFVKNSLVLTLI